MTVDTAQPRREGKGLSPELVRLIVGQVCLHSTMAGARMAAPLLALHLGYGKLAAGLLVSLFALSQIFLLLPAGRYADRHGLKRPVRWCVLAASIGAGLAAIWPGYPMLCVAAVLCGGAIGAGNVALQRHVGKAAESPAHLKQVFSWLSIAPPAANFVGPFLAGVAIDLAGYRAAFSLLAVMPIAAWLLIRRARELPGEGRPPSEHGTAWDLLRKPVVRRLLFMNWLVSASWDLHAIMLPMLGHDRGLPASVIGTILGIFAIGAVAIRFTMPMVGARVPEWMLIGSATTISALLLLTYPFTHSALGMGLCSAALGMAVGSVQPMVMSLLHQVTPRHRHGEVIAVRLIMINTSSVGMPLLLGAAGSAVGVGIVFWVMGAIVAAGSPLSLKLRGLGEPAADP